MLTNIKNKIKLMDIYNTDYVDLSIKNILNNMEFKNIILKYNVFNYTINTLMVIIFLYSIYFCSISYNNIYVMLPYASFSIFMGFKFFKKGDLKKMITPIIFSITLFITSMFHKISMNLSKFIIILNKKKEDGHIIKVNLNLQEFSYKDGLLSSDDFSLATKLENKGQSLFYRETYVGDYYYKGVKNKETKMLTKEDYENFKKEIDQRILKQKINRF
jgi:hypothetical protein